MRGFYIQFKANDGSKHSIFVFTSTLLAYDAESISKAVNMFLIDNFAGSKLISVSSGIKE